MKGRGEMEIKTIIETLESRLNTKRDEYGQMQDYFRFTATKDLGTSNYERNAIDELSAMLQLAAEIRELEFVLSLLRASCTKNPTA